ncbi:hypothetical protein VNO80_34022 [Phaseolus coccineus]|uniref:Uncharacterized protein n=1 Tax=Phaseolus coccineus TaxID=3886 RepID=A0AAN9KZ39_PHACN
MGGGAWPFLVGGAICLVNSVNERDLSLLNSYVEVCDALRCSGPHARYTDVFNESYSLGRQARRTTAGARPPVCVVERAGGRLGASGRKPVSPDKTLTPGASCAKEYEAVSKFGTESPAISVDEPTLETNRGCGTPDIMDLLTPHAPSVRYLRDLRSGGATR